LWVSDENEYGWLEWCKEEEFHYPERFQYAYEIHLTEKHNVLILRTTQDLIEFTQAHKPVLTESSFQLDWIRARRWWDGVIITPYQQEFRWLSNAHLEYIWYYLWDCASGCIWNPEAIRSFDTCQKYE
jgi:hypothetical protein